MTFAVCTKEGAYCANLFYVFNEESLSLIFASNIDSKHIKDAIANPNIGGTISKETKNISKIQGVQFRGRLKSSLDFKEGRSYFKRFVFAKKIKLSLWAVELNFIKFTDNTLGFGKKFIYKKD